MNRKYLLKNQIYRAKVSRLIAKAIDLFIVLILSIILHPLGVILSVIYLSIADSLQGGQSVGKKVIGFNVISLEDGTPCNSKQSFIRNLPLIVPLCFAIVPFWGWVISVLLAAPLIGLELWLLFKLDSGHRLGDVMADTSVIGNDPDQAHTRQATKGWFENSSNSSTPCP